ncbi:21446_t:CDS:2 [Cetraspora pellucida]|uniref:21446_t:CDS:1 n=1 Tax=Cetraspora pellucida TaxID=1433469 RepID=A0A9N9BW59_9GLOM|nr:21446_t:CDS:2 [Cetraspora pellucida]
MSSISDSQTPCPDPVVSTYTQNQKQRIAEASAKIETLNDIGLIVKKAVREALQNLNIDNDLKEINEALKKIDNEDLKKLINEKTEEIKAKLGDFQVSTPIEADDIASTLEQLANKYQSNLDTTGNRKHDTASESSNDSDLETKKIILNDDIEKIHKAIENKENIDLDKTIGILKQVSNLTITDYNRVYDEQNETINALKLINLNLACEVQYYKGCLCEELIQTIKEWFNDLLDIKYTNAKGTVKINGYSINVVFDSGCSESSMPNHIREQLGLQITDYRCSPSTTSNGEKKTCYGMLMVDIEIGDKNVNFLIKVVESIKDYLLLELKDKLASLKIENNELKNKFYMIEKLKKKQKPYTCQCDVKINDIETNICINSGCNEMSFMTMKKAKKLGLKIKPADENDYCMGVGGQSKIEGVSSTIIEFDGIKFPIHFEIGNTTSILIGCNFLKCYNAEINFKTEYLKLTHNDKTIKIKLDIY